MSHSAQVATSQGRIDRVRMSSPRTPLGAIAQELATRGIGDEVKFVYPCCHNFPPLRAFNITRPSGGLEEFT